MEVGAGNAFVVEESTFGKVPRKLRSWSSKGDSARCLGNEQSEVRMDFAFLDREDDPQWTRARVGGKGKNIQNGHECRLFTGRRRAPTLPKRVIARSWVLARRHDCEE